MNRDTNSLDKHELSVHGSDPNFLPTTARSVVALGQDVGRFQFRVDSVRLHLMGFPASDDSFLASLIGKLRGQKAAEPAAPLFTPLGMLDRLHSGEQPDYCLYVRPAAGRPVAKNSPLSIDLEELLAKAFDPLPVVTLDEYAAPPTGGPVPDESFLALANRARILCLVPTADRQFVHRLRILKALGPIQRCVLVMPEAATLGSADWPTLWPAAKLAVEPLGIELSGYTPGGWLFRLDKEGKAVTFRPIVNPNAEKIARALEGICVEME